MSSPEKAVAAEATDVNKGNLPPSSVKPDPEAAPSTSTKRERSPDDDDNERDNDKSEQGAAKKMKQENGQASPMDEG